MTGDQPRYFGPLGPVLEGLMKCACGPDGGLPWEKDNPRAPGLMTPFEAVHHGLLMLARVPYDTHVARLARVQKLARELVSLADEASAWTPYWHAGVGFDASRVECRAFAERRHNGEIDPPSPEIEWFDVDAQRCEAFTTAANAAAELAHELDWAKGLAADRLGPDSPREGLLWFGDVCLFLKYQGLGAKASGSFLERLQPYHPSLVWPSSDDWPKTVKNHLAKFKRVLERTRGLEAQTQVGPLALPP